MKSYAAFILAMALSAGSIGAEAERLPECAPDNAAMTIPLHGTDAAPTIDGRFAEGEWRLAVQCAGFVKTDTRALVPGQKGFVSLRRDRDFLYLGIRTTTPTGDPGGGLVCKEKNRDGAVTADDSVEILFTPDTEPETLYRLAVNAEGVVADGRRGPGAKKSDAAWDCGGLRVGTTVESGWWFLELALPLAELGLPAESLRLNVLRNWSGIGTSALHVATPECDGTSMFHVTWSENAPLWQQTDWGSPESGLWNAAMEVTNLSGRAVTLAAVLRRESPGGKATTAATEKTSGQVQANESALVAAGASGTLTLKHLLDGSDPAHLSILISDPDTGQAFYARRVTGVKGAVVGRRPATAAFDLPGAGSGVVWYYPGFHRATFLLTLLPSAEADSDSVSVAVAGGEPVRATREKDGFRAVVGVGTDPGDYAAEVRLTSRDGKSRVFPDVCRLTKKKFAWEDNRLGEDQIVIPPFIPVTVEKDTVVTLTHRLRVGPLGLWESLLTQEREVLAAPMRLELTEAGQMQAWTGSAGEPQIMDGGYEACFQTQARTPSGTVLRSQTRCEADGFYWIDMTLDGIGGRQVDRVKLVIPVKDSEAPLFHAVANSIRTNPAGKVPPGAGEVWNGSGLARRTHFGEEMLIPQFVPYLWVGGIERGLCWFADSSLGMRLDPEQSAVRLIRRGDALEMEIDLVNRPVRGKDSLAFAFGLQATPVKPLDPALRRVIFDSMGIGAGGMDRAIFVYNHQLGYPHTWSKLPYEHDFSLFRRAVETWRTGAFPDSAEMVRPWMEKYDGRVMELMNRIPNPGSSDNPEKFRNTRESFRRQNFDDRRRGPARPYLFTNPRLTYMMDEAPEYFKAEWWNPAAHNYFGAWRTFPVPSQLDYLAYAYAEEMKNGMQGAYLDDCYLMPETNPDTVAQIDDEGQLHSRVGILALRELVKRIAVLQHQHGLYPRILHVHMTNALLVPCFSYATGQVGFEMNYGAAPHPERFTLDHVQAIGLGRQIGATSLLIPGIRLPQASADGQSRQKERLLRAMLAFILPHDIRQMARHEQSVLDTYRRMNDFGCWRDDSRFVPYWEHDPALAVSAPEVLVTSYRLPGKTLAVIANFSAEPRTVAVSVDRAGLAVVGNAPFADLETGTEVDPGAVALGGYDFRLVTIGR